MADPTVHDNERRIARLESRVDRHDDEIGNLKVINAGLEAWRIEEQARHSSAPAWLFGTISTVLVIISLVIQYWLVSGASAP